MARVATATAIERCELCGARLGSGPGARLGHLRDEHPAYGRGLVMRMAAPLVFALSVLLLGALGAPQWAYVFALAAGFGFALLGRAVGRSARARSGITPGVPLRRLFKDGALRVAVVIPLALLAIFLFSRR